MIALSAAPPIPPPVQAYLEALVRTCLDSGRPLVSVVLFGSAATGGFSATASDVDLILVVPDGTSGEDKNRLRDGIERIEALHGFRENPTRSRGPLSRFPDSSTPPSNKLSDRSAGSVFFNLLPGRYRSRF